MFNIKQNKRLRFLVTLLVITTLFSTVCLAKTISVSPNVEKDCLYYFYGEESPEGKNVDTFLFTLQQKYPNITIETYEVYYNQQNNELLDQYFKVFGVDKESQGIPVIFLGGSYFVGAQSITSLLEGSIKNNPSSACPSLQEVQTIGVVGTSSSPEILNTISFFKVTGEALKNIFSPGMMALLLILLVILTVTTEKENILKRGALFIVGVYLAYLIFGIGKLDILYNTTLGKLFTKMVAIGALAFALAQIKAFFGTWKILLKNFPKDLKKILKKHVRQILSPIGIPITGFILAMFTFFSADTTLVLIRNLFEGQYKRAIVFPILLYHNVIIILLLILTTIGFYFLRKKLDELAHQKGKDNQKKKELLQKHHLKILNFAIYFLILVLGIVVLFL